MTPNLREQPGMEVESLSIPDLVLIRPRRFGDARGWFSETFNTRLFRERVADASFVQDNEALSAAAGTLRGLHFQRPPMAQGKLVRCVRGAIWDVAVDIRHGSPSFGFGVGVRLDGAEGAQLWVPEGFAHGYRTLEPDTLVAYKVTRFYSPADEGGIRWNDPALQGGRGLDWPGGPGEPMMAERDRTLPYLAELPPLFAYDGGAAR